MSVREQLQQAEVSLRALREERNRAAKVAESAKAAFAASDDPEGSPTFLAAQGATEAVKEVDQKIDAANDEQVSLLRRLGDAEAGRAGFASPGVDGWRDAARKLDLQRGETRVDLAGSVLLAAQAPASGGGVATASGSSSPISVQTPADRANARTILYPWALPQEPFPASEFAASDYTVDFSQAALSGVERDIDAQTTKADLGASVGLVTPVSRLFAITASNIPERIFSNESSLQTFLEQEMRRGLDVEIDQHVVDVITASSPPSGSTGSDLIAKVRHAVAAHRQLGSSPSVLALNPETAADLDLTTESGSGAYVFVIRGQGADVLWTLTVVESQAVTDPMLLDPVRLGVLLVGSGSILADPFSGMSENTVRLRCEVEACATVRAASGAYLIA